MEYPKSTRKYWLYFFLWLAFIIFLLIMPNLRPFFWIALPGTVTYFALAMRLV